MRYLLIPSVSLPYFKSKHAFAFLFPCVLRLCHHIPPKQLLPTFTFHIFPFSAWAQSGDPPPAPAPCLLDILPFRTDLSSALSGGSRSTSSPGPFCLSLWWDLAFPNKPRVALWKVKISTCLLSGSLSPSYDCSQHWSTFACLFHFGPRVAEWAEYPSWPITLLKKLSSMPSWFIAFNPSLLPFQQILGLWKSPGRSRSGSQKVLSADCLISSAFSPFWWFVADTHDTALIVGLPSHSDP